MTMKQQPPSNNAFKVDQKSTPRVRASDPVPDPSLPDAPEITGLLGPVPGDPQNNVVPKSVQAEGPEFTFERWFPVASLPGEFDELSIFVEGRRTWVETFDMTNMPLDPVILSLESKANLQTHGVKDIKIEVLNHDSTGTPANLSEYNILRVFVDARDPNLNDTPPAITLPGDLPGAVVTPDYLAGKLGLTCTIPRPVDSKGGDTWQAFWGVKDEVGISGVVPLTGPIEVIFPTAMVLEGKGDIAITYRVVDRAGNITQTSDPRTVTVVLDEPPGLGDLTVVEAPLIDKEEARNGVTIEIGDITGYLPTDRVQVYWHTILVEDRPIGAFPIFPMKFTADFATVSQPGNFYTADVQYFVFRSGDPLYPSAVVNVDVDLREPGIDNPGPGPEDPSLDRPVVTGESGLTNRLVEEDRNFPATARFTIPEGLVLGDFIDIYYGTEGGTLGSTYPVVGDEADDYVVELEIAWDIVDSYGNGRIPCYYKIRNAVNFKHSPVQEVVVEIFSLNGLAPATFENADNHPTYGRQMLCRHSPWLGVPIKILDPGVLLVGDKVTVHAVRYRNDDPTTPVGDPVKSLETEVLFNDIEGGLIINLDLGDWFRDFTGTQGRGFVGVRWSLFRPSTNDRGISDESQAHWDFRRTGSPFPTCVPDSTRGRGAKC